MARYITIPENVLNDERLCANAKILYGYVRSLCTEKGYCWASNKHLANLMKVSIQSVSTWLKDLKEFGYIEMTYNYKVGTKEILNRYTKILEEGIQENFKENNKENNKRYIYNTFKKIFNTYDELPTYDTSRNAVMSLEEQNELLKLMGKQNVQQV